MYSIEGQNLAEIKRANGSSSAIPGLFLDSYTLVVQFLFRTLTFWTDRTTTTFVTLTLFHTASEVVYDTHN